MKFQDDSICQQYKSKTADFIKPCKDPLWPF